MAGSKSTRREPLASGVTTDLAGADTAFEKITVAVELLRRWQDTGGPGDANGPQAWLMFDVLAEAIVQQARIGQKALASGQQ